MPVTLTPDTLLAFKAGRAFRNGDTSTVVPDPTKGAIMLTNGEDGLLHFIWKNRDTNNIEEVRCGYFVLSPDLLIVYFQDLILFPTDATFSKVNQSSSGRVYVLKFSSSNQRHFVCSVSLYFTTFFSQMRVQFWMQVRSTPKIRMADCNNKYL